ncbi:hypothetical protein [Clostridium botulinum]
MIKSKYETQVKDKLILVGGLARNGFTDKQIAKNLGQHLENIKRNI